MAFAYRGSLTNIRHKTYGTRSFPDLNQYSGRPTLSDGLYPAPIHFKESRKGRLKNAIIHAIDIS